MKIGRLFAERFVENGITLDDSWQSEPITVGAGFNFAVQVFLYNDADAYGTLHFETTIDQNGTWHKIPITNETSIPITPGNNVDEIYDVGCLGTGFVRLRYERNGGSALLDLTGIRKRIH
jgi:hypothetical protein